MLDKNDRIFIYTVSELYRERDQLSVKDNHKHPALAENIIRFPACAVIASVRREKQKLDEKNEMEFIDRNLLS